jgi:aryl-alcohol dehydrogenase-like predicted oxidoreductase
VLYIQQERVILNKKKNLTRKAFLKKSWAGITGAFAYNLIGKSNRDLVKNAKTGMRVLGRTGIQVTPIGFGAARIMEPALLLAALDRGINFIDTGRGYFNGRNETMVGETLKGRRDRIVIQSKMKVKTMTGDAGKDYSDRILKAMESSLKDSLKALKTDYIDIMLIHGVSTKAEISHEAVMRFLESAKRKGIIRAHGFSCHNEPEPLEWGVETAFYDIIMFPFNHRGEYVHMNSGRSNSWDQPLIERLIPKAHKQKIGIIAMKTCSGGPFSPDPAAAPSYPEALKWVLNRRFIDCAAVAMVNFNQIDENTGAILNHQ